MNTGTLLAVRFFAVASAISTAPPAIGQTRTPYAPIKMETGAFASPTPRFRFADTLKEQEAQLASNPLMQRFAASRNKLAKDRYRPAYHFVSPESSLNDPNGLSFWKGRWHLFYQAFPPDEYPIEADADKRRQHWGHAVSDDLVHWRDLPYAIYPGVEKMVFSGSTMVERDRVIAVYPGVGIGPPTYFPTISASLMVATSSDPLLLNWEKSAPVDIPTYDPDIWKQGDTYYSISGTIDRYYPNTAAKADRFRHPFHQEMYGIGGWTNWSVKTSKNLKDWSTGADLLPEKNPFLRPFDDGACSNFQKIGDKHILLFFSHTRGGQYLLGDYDESSAKFRPYDHGRFNHGQVAPGGIYCPSATTDGNGDVISIFNIGAAKPTFGWDQLMSLPQRLALDADKRLRIEPIPAIVSLREGLRSINDQPLPSDREVVLEAIAGDTMELYVEIDPADAQSIQLNVLRSPDASERTSITFFNTMRSQNLAASYTSQEIVLDASESSLAKDVTPRPPERAALNKESGEPLKLRIFIDRSVVEVFANGKQYLATRVYPDRDDSRGVSLKARGGSATLRKLNAWNMKSIWPHTASPK